MLGKGQFAGWRAYPLHPVTVRVLGICHRVERDMDSGWVHVHQPGLTTETQSSLSAGDRYHRELRDHNPNWVVALYRTHFWIGRVFRDHELSLGCGSAG